MAGKQYNMVANIKNDTCRKTHLASQNPALFFMDLLRNF